ncbi:hypothetical protein ACTVZO_22275 [Streptomyces sp. IBSNAI002]|uniref:hypothetical protein n=1 Tax=Streptomyces sp. IBSNAI002 TaxID=3457500 RepID=UPI003FD3ADA5
MTLDAQAWVWKHSRTRGNARLVMLAVADATTGPEAETRMGTAEVMQRLNVSRSTARAAVDAALALGELIEKESAKGSRATLYQLPGAVGYTRSTGPNLGPPAQMVQGPDSGPLTPTGPNPGPSTGPNLGPPTDPPEPPYRAESRPPWGPESGPHHSSIDGVNEGVREGAPSSVPPEFARELVDKITAAEIYPAWDLRPGEWFQVDALLKRSGVDMLAAVAVKAASKRDVSHARYFLRAWLNLPPAAAPGTVPPPRTGADVIPLDRAPRRGKAANAAAMFAAAAGITPQEHHR